jgi:ATP-dependent DNA ligase
MFVAELSSLRNLRQQRAAWRLPDNGLAAWGVVKERGYEGPVAKNAESVYWGGPTRSWVKVKIRPEGDMCSAVSSGCRRLLRASW